MRPEFRDLALKLHERLLLQWQQKQAPYRADKRYERMVVHKHDCLGFDEEDDSVSEMLWTEVWTFMGALLVTRYDNRRTCRTVLRFLIYEGEKDESGNLKSASHTSEVEISEKFLWSTPPEDQHSEIMSKVLGALMVLWEDLKKTQKLPLLNTDDMGKTWDVRFAEGEDRVLDFGNGYRGMLLERRRQGVH